MNRGPSVESAWRRLRAVGVILGEVGRRAWRYGWPRVGRNRAYLHDRLIALPLLAVLAFSTFGWAYGTVRGDTTYLRDRLTPALVDLADAKISLRIAQYEATRSLSIGSAAELSGLNEAYRKRVYRATQRLSKVAQSGALTVSQQQELGVVTGLLTDYSGWINRAQIHAADRTLREAELTYAMDMLCPTQAARGTGADHRFPTCRGTKGSDSTTIVDRIETLEDQLHRRLDDRSAFSGGVIAAAAVSAVAFVLLTVGLYRTVGFLNRRFRIRVSLPLLVAFVPLALIPFLTVDGVLAQHAQHSVRSLARVLADETKPETETADESSPSDEPSATSVKHLDKTLRDRLTGGRFPGLELDGLAPFVAPVGLVAAAVTAGALHGYRREYLAGTRPGALT